MSRTWQKTGSWNRLVLQGGLAGIAAAVPMTVTMLAMKRLLPPHEQYPLPPVEITWSVAQQAGVGEAVDEEESLTLTSGAAHLGYSALSGAAYGMLFKPLRAPVLLKILAFSLALWGGSYLGWLPAMNILKPATDHPPRRNLLMIAAHLVFGAVVGWWMERNDKEIG